MVGAELEKAIADAQEHYDELATGVRAMAKDLDAIIDRERAIREGLVPFLVARESVRGHEGEWKRAKEGYAEAEGKAAELELLATNVESIRKAHRHADVLRRRGLPADASVFSSERMVDVLRFMQKSSETPWTK
jgi:hypothetical protein